MYDFLQGVRIVELGHILMGPYAAQFLGDFGADVIKVEPPEGDFYRSVGVSNSPGMSSQWMNVNRNKRSVVLDLKTERGREAMRALVGTADAFVHNMRPSAVERLGFDYAHAKVENPEIVYCFAGGFGSEGPYGDRPAFDDIIQGFSGMAAVNAAQDGAPRLVPLSMADTLVGLMLSQAVLAGLFRRAQTGKGACIEVPMFEAVASVVFNQHLAGRAYEPARGDFGYQRLLSPHRRPCATKDGYIVHGLYKAKHWRAFLEAVGRKDVIERGLIDDNDALARNIPELYRIASEEILPHRTTAQWRRLFSTLDVPSAPANALADVAADEHLEAVELFERYDHPTEGRVRGLRLPMSVSGAERLPDRPPPRLGAHTEEVLDELGLLGPTRRSGGAAT